MKYFIVEAEEIYGEYSFKSLFAIKDISIEDAKIKAIDYMENRWHNGVDMEPVFNQISEISQETVEELINNNLMVVI